MSAAIYARISEDRAANAAGVDRQLAECRQLAERRGLGSPVEFVDNDISAMSGKRRPAFEALLAAIESGEVDSVIAWHTDRLYRLPRDLEPLIKLADSRPVSFVTVNAGDIDLNTATGRMVARILASVSAQEIEHRTERQVAKNAQQLREGVPLRGNRPFGFEVDRLAIRESEAALIREAYATIAEGGTLYSIQRALNQSGIRTPRGNTWSYATIRQLLLRERNAGRLIAGKGVAHRVIRDDLSQIVSPEQFEAVRLILSDPKRETAPGPKVTKHFLSGVAICGVCGAGMRSAVSSSRGRRQESYKCGTKASGRGHGQRHASIARHVVEAAIPGAVWGALVELVQGGGDVAEKEAAELGPLRARRASLEADRAELQKIENIRGVDLSAFAAQMQAVADEIDGITERVTAILRANTTEHALAPVREFVAAIERAAEDRRTLTLDEHVVLLGVRREFEEAWHGLSVEQKRDLTRATVDVVVSPVDVSIRRSFSVAPSADDPTASVLVERVDNPERPERLSITPKRREKA
ncbi:hypothetical protein GCM10009840_18020 [Pseudolysinimonas kribbensis]|uniref:Recombinase family protein n=1 Tax=Pseudolysinimonas kribbensis TaxID=433641 RepID=A0ABQ6K4W3_9MICO|nr:recombinase family protein [Pseudolysinimonas kribbensis]GMA93816.1 hypothetical protein GCM10025881_06400 [Pseudolysinimonas kribbensis]